MSRVRSYYDLFDVPSTASAREIRAAYVRLMKNHHPDLPRPPQDAAPDIAATINQCYAVLKSPERRLAYDARLARATAPPRELRRRLVRRRRGYSKPVMLAAAGALLAALGVMFVVQWWGGWQPSQPPWLRPAESLTNGWTGRQLPMPNRQDVLQQVHSAMSASLPRAAYMSQACYQRARKTESGAIAQNCVIFDEAFLYSADTGRADRYEYFDPQIVHIRQTGLLSSFQRDPEDRLDKLRGITFLNVLAEVRSKRELHDRPAAPPEDARAGQSPT